MAGPPLPTKASGTMLFLVFGAVVGSFCIATVVTQRASLRVEALSDAIVYDTTPRIERLAALRGIAVEAELALSRYLQDVGAARGGHERALNASLEEMGGNIAHLAVAPTDGGHPHWNQLRSNWTRFDQAVRRAKAAADGGRTDEAWARIGNEVDPATAQMVDVAMKAIDFNAGKERELAEEIKQTRRRTVWLLNGLTVFSAVLGLAGALLLDRQTRSRRALVEAHAQFLEARAAELEQFAGRVAHDIRNPLAAARLSAQLIERRSSDASTKELCGRIVRSLSRANAITTGLLDFARSGAQPEPGARTTPAEVLADLAMGMAPEADNAGIDLRFEPAPAVQVGCSTGVYLSLVGNLVRNAIKYMSESPPRQITVRVVEQAGEVRTEVSDTGPGIPRDKQPFLFEPFFRADGGGRDGLGLGLATVKKLAEGHHGRVGLSSEPGRGSTFWFVLPRVESAPVAARVAPREEPAPGRPTPAPALHRGAESSTPLNARPPSSG